MADDFDLTTTDADPDLNDVLLSRMIPGPYVLLTLTPTSGEGLGMSLTSGHGITDRKDIRDMLTLALQAIPPEPSDV